MNRKQRNDDYLNTGAPALQDTDPEPPARLSFSWWLQFVVLMWVIFSSAAVLFCVVDAAVKLFR